MSDRQCTATSKRTHERCLRVPAPGALVCRWHGGASPQAKAKAELRRTMEEHQARAQRILKRPVTDPIAELQKLAADCLIWRDQMAEAMTKVEEIRYRSGAGEQVRGELAAYEKAMVETRQVLVALARLQLDERMVTIREHEADIFAAILATVFRHLKLTPDVICEAETLVAVELQRALNAGRQTGEPQPT